MLNLSIVLQRTAKKCTKNYNALAQPLFCSLNLLFSDVPVAVAVVVFLNSLMLSRRHCSRKAPCSNFSNAAFIETNLQMMSCSVHFTTPVMITSVGLLPRMSSHVLCQVALSNKRLHTAFLFTSERVSRVTSSVRLQPI